MINRMKVGLITLLGVVIWGFTPGVVHAANAHAVACNVCHRSSAGPRSMANLCVVCHIKSGETQNPVARFDVGTASDTLGHNSQKGTDSGAETTHNWGGFSTNWAPAGSTYPPTTFYSSRYSISTKRITCTICHDPHGVTGPNYLVRAEIAGDVLCQQCHSSWFILNDSNDADPVNDTNALLTHPVVTDYATFAAANPTDYNPTPANASNGGSGEVRLVDGGVSCTSCHGTHYADSSSDTTDGTGTYNAGTMAKGDGNLLRADGPLRMTGTPALPGPRNGATGTAQLRSNLCQSCHKIELHGQGKSGDHQIGCLDCHGGHAYNGGVPNAYILNTLTPDEVPTRPNGVNGISVQVTFENFPNGASTRLTWADEEVGGTAGFCEKCHGDVNSAEMVLAAEAHGKDDTNECDVCHKHNDPADLYSFNRDASAATCGQCHGFPPYLNVRGDQGNDPDGTGPNPPLGTLGGYAWNYVDLPAYDYVNSTTHEKNEEQTGHMVHAGADLPTSPAGVGGWYFVGNSGVDNCRVCHGPDAGATAGNHRINQANTFRDLPFDGIAKTGGMSPVYKTGAPNIWTCSNVYCHTNGAPYIEASRATLTRDYSFTNVTPAWDQANGGGFNAIYGNANRCQFCHGNNTTSMSSKSNSPAHQAHLGATTTLNMGIVFDCKTCHVETASSPTALADGAMDGRNGVGKHVNGTIEVDFETGPTVDTLPYELTGSTYTATTGICSTYCHNATGAGGAMAADWDVTTDMQCDSCHGGLLTDSSGNGGYGPITTDSHPLHVTNINGPRLACTVCHGTDANVGKHGTHLDGDFDFSAGVCDTCHGYDLAQGEALPVWGATPYTDPDPSKRDDYCIACHTGTTKTPVVASGGIAAGAPAKNNALSTGHGLPGGTYILSGNNAANRACTACHDSSAAGHFDGISGDDKRLLLGSNGFPVAYSTIADKNNYCGACHGTAPGHSLPSTKTGINTHQGKACIGCHDPHGDSNRSMIMSSQSTQNAKDTTTGKFFGDVTFIAQIDAFSYDEDEGATGNADEDNANDICATCHTTGGGSAHNNQQNLPATGTHNQGSNCLTVCHNAHNDAVETNAFGGGVGNACNDCHGYPPATGDARHTAAKIGAHELHASSLLNVGGAEASDCEVCHPGATGYQLFPSGTHMDSSLGGPTTLAAGMAGGTATCTNSCHLSSATVDGYWTDTTKAGFSGNGLNCNACHYAADVLTATGALNLAAGTRQLSAVHNEHFDKRKGCAECHDVSYSSGITSIPGGVSGLIHISGGASDGTLAFYQNRAQALPDEATVTRTNMSYSGGATDASGTNNTCAGTASTGFAVGCHASAGLPGATSKPDWDVTIPATSAGCEMCHTNTTSSAYNPTSGIHGNSPGPQVTSNAHDGSFDDGTLPTGGNCVTCHTTSPTGTPTDHINNTLNTGSAITVAAIAGYSVATADCATTCHSAGTAWRYKWSTSAYDPGVAQCDNCHGMYGSWVTGVTPHTNAPTKGSKHNNVGNLTYPCTDCHGLGSAGYKWTTKWDPNGTNSSHGNDKITMNQMADTTFTVNTGRAGCTVACHVWDTAHNFPVTTTTLLTETVTGPKPDVLCSGCHGGYAPGGTTILGYWPDSIGGGAEDDAGAHLKHMTALAQSKYGENLTQLLTDNTPGNFGIAAEDKQKFLCAYCHGTASGNPMDVTHGLVSYLPADVTRIYNQWDLTQATPDNGVYTPGTYTCATVDCHFNKTTPTTNDWYDAPGNGTCIMCHVDVTQATDAGHNSHIRTATGTTFGRVSLCADCHEAQTNWATNTPPGGTGHLNNTYAIAGARLTSYTGFTYPAVKGTCGTNLCHNSGNGIGAPAVNPTWGTTQADCTICHAAVPTVTAAHTPHLANTTLVPSGCNECHEAATANTHLDLKVDFGGDVTAPADNVAYNGSCTNNCHVAGSGDWSGGAAALACTDCHAGSYVGGNNWRALGNNYLAQSGLHAMTATNVTSHDQNLSGGCEACHSSYASAPGTHVNNFWQAEGPANTESRFISLAGYSEQASNSSTCSGGALTACHTDKGYWARLWSTAADSNYVATPATGQAVCNVCHGYYAAISGSAGWRAGTVHALSGTDKGNGHTDSNLECEDCHAYPSASGNHEDGFITMAGDTDANLTTGEDFQLVWGTHATNKGWYCASCHSLQAAEDALNATSHTFVDSTAFPSPTKTPTHEKIRYADGVSAPEGGCTGCHGNTSTGGQWPDGSKGGLRVPGTSGPADQVGLHPQHVTEIAKKKYATSNPSSTQKNGTCDYCHPNPGGGGHNDATAPATMHDGSTTKFKRIISPFGNDNNGMVSGSGTAYVTCNNIDCHFDMPRTPHWYTDDIAPGEILDLAATPGALPRSISISWTAPGDDDYVANTTPYVYDMRYSVDDAGADANNFSSTTNLVGGLPAAYKQGSLSVMLLENLTAGSEYFFSVRTQDTAGNWSTPSSVVGPFMPTADNLAPSFGGANLAVRGDDSQTINVEWSHAEDHTMPIKYSVWMVEQGTGFGQDGKLDMDNDPPVVVGYDNNVIQLNNADHGVLNDKIYMIGVRACDSVTPTSKCDDNTQVVSATAMTPHLVEKKFYNYKTNGSTTLVKDGGQGTGLVDQALPKLFTPSANVADSTDYYVDSFTVQLYSATGGTAQLQIGTTTDGSSSTFTAFPEAKFTKTVTLARKARRLVTFKISDSIGKNVPTTARIAANLTNVTGSVVASYGTSATGGILSAGERLVNQTPNGPALTASIVNNTIVRMNWTSPYTDDLDGVTTDTVHYDIYGTTNNGTDWFLIDYDLDGSLTTYDWKTQLSGVTSTTQLGVKLRAGDTYGHTDKQVIGLSVDNTGDNVAPNAITDLKAQKRAKSGTIWLTWTSPGDDEWNHGQASGYDIRYRRVFYGVLDEGSWNDVNTLKAASAPVPDFGKKIQNFELTGLLPNEDYYIAIKTFDDATPTPKYSAISNVVQELGGPRCGMCHATAPSVLESVGNHKLHGFTLQDCDKCHTADPQGTPIKPSEYGLDHQDGQLVMGYGDLGAFPAIIVDANELYYTFDGNPHGGDMTKVLYRDTDGYGGFADGTYPPPTGEDSGTCSSFSNRTLGGCHGPAGTDPDGVGGSYYPSYTKPTWIENATLACANCHGNPNRLTNMAASVDNVYGRAFDGHLANAVDPQNPVASELPEQIAGAPAIDNHGNLDNPSDPTEANRKYVGQHEKHLNYSFRLSKGDSCNLCHPGEYQDKATLDRRHANGKVDVVLDVVAAGADAKWNSGTATTAGSCSGLSDINCHPGTEPDPKWDNNQSFDCVKCHGFAGVTPSHVTDPNNTVIAPNGGWATDPMPGNCTYCHFGGHPTDEVYVGGVAQAIILPNSSQVGINYKSGGIHLRKNIGGMGSYSTEAELCWGCHDRNGISEWGPDNSWNNGSANNATEHLSGNGRNYNYGTLAGGTTSNWLTGGNWRSANQTNFSYKNGPIQSTHTSNKAGSSALNGGGSAYNYTESPDPVNLIRCSNCHDVHNMNKAPGDKSSGNPYLRGTWKSNPYLEDGAPRSGMTYTAVNTSAGAFSYGQVPRGGTTYNQTGGYQIDQNNSNPTSGWSLSTSAGLCTLCHGTDIEALDEAPSESLWLGSNGHSNSALGGTTGSAANIFTTNIRNPNGAPVNFATTTVTGNGSYAGQAVMGYEHQSLKAAYGEGIRGQVPGRTGRGWDIGPGIPGEKFYQGFDWGVSQEVAAAVDTGYHAFSCSKCHNPHASRLPKLMITNCLDTNHNTWDNSYLTPATNTANGSNTSNLSADNGEVPLSSVTSAQNCHRYKDRQYTNSTGNGWNKVTPWHENGTKLQLQ